MIEIKNLYKNYENIAVFDDFSIQFQQNKITAISGVSGVGKTTLLRIISGLTAYNCGEISGVDNKKISFIFQEKRIIPWFNVNDNIDFVLKKNYKNKSERNSIIEGVLSDVGLAEKRFLMPSELSGGMKQRLSIARSFAYPSDIILMDEPFKELDLTSRDAVVRSFLHLWEKKKPTVIFITHNIDELLLISDYIYVLHGIPAKIIFSEKINSSKIDRNLSEKEFCDMKNTLEKLL